MRAQARTLARLDDSPNLSPNANQELPVSLQTAMTVAAILTDEGFRAYATRASGKRRAKVITNAPKHVYSSVLDLVGVRS